MVVVVVRPVEFEINVEGLSDVNFKIFNDLRSVISAEYSINPDVCIFMLNTPYDMNSIGYSSKTAFNFCHEFHVMYPLCQLWLATYHAIDESLNISKELFLTRIVHPDNIIMELKNHFK